MRVHADGEMAATCYTDEAVEDGETYCYWVSAINAYGGSGLFQTDCAIALQPLLRPRILPHGGLFNDFVWVTITNENPNPNITIRYTTNGVAPTALDFIEYTGAFRLESSAQVIAVAVLDTSVSIDDRADFHIAQPTAIACGETKVSMLATTNQPSFALGPWHYGSRFAFPGARGTNVQITVLYADFDAYVALKDPNGVIVAANDDNYRKGQVPALDYTLRTNGTYVFEVTSVSTERTGNFAVSMTCSPVPELDVFLGSTNLTNNTTLDFGIRPNGTTNSFTVSLTNSGAATLAMSNLTVTPYPMFTLNLSALTNLAAHTATNLTITFNATNNGPQTGVVRFDNNDTDDLEDVDAPFVINLAAYVNPDGIPPTVSISTPYQGSTNTVPPNLTVTGLVGVTTNTTVSNVVLRAILPTGIVKLGTDSSGNLHDWSVNVTNPPTGTITLNAIATDAVGRSTLSTNVTIIINSRPIAVTDRRGVYKNTTNDLDVLSNDSDPDGHPLTLTSISTGPAHGTATNNGNYVRYIPATDYSGQDSFTYAIADSRTPDIGPEDFEYC